MSVLRSRNHLKPFVGTGTVLRGVAGKSLEGGEIVRRGVKSNQGVGESFGERRLFETELKFVA